jgi:L-cysteine S-thiosulfotransferase
MGRFQMNSKVLQAIALCFSVLLVGGCSSLSTPFAYPIDLGNIDAGKQAFIDQQCQRCHSVSGVILPELAGASPPLLQLGGPTSRVRTYAELFTSVVNPNHVISDVYRDQLMLEGRVPVNSPMPTPDLDNMTVRQLIDLLAFLDAQYQQVEEYDSSN